MFRSIIRCATSLNPAVLQEPRKRFIPEALKLSSNLRQISLSVPRCENQRKRRPRRSTDFTKTSEDGASVSPEVQEAAVQAAKSLPGDWTKTAEELLARLQTKTELSADGEERQKGEAKSLLSTMQVGRSFEAGLDKRRSGRRVQRHQKDDDLGDVFYPQSRLQKFSDSKISPGRRRDTFFKDLYGVPRLGIFEAKQKTEVAHEQSKPENVDDLWAQVEKEHILKLQGGLPRNAFEEMIKLTKQGKVWTFPVDNEADLHEERKYKFQDHVFLERHLTAFPRTGPVRKFMELVTLGLSQNPWLSVPEKLEHIAWFAQYFREKQDVLKSTLGQEGEMRESSGEDENSVSLK